ncbi:MAG: hypothetical protein JHC33_01995 [Ignisphaera sp.]|jgi:hypothetical protein|nr:hypothetical protein [Ignisphaera sp.]
MTPEQHEYLRLRKACSDTEHEIQQILGKALDYPWFKDNKKVWPDATEEDGVCVGEQVSVTLAMEASDLIKDLEKIIAEKIITALIEVGPTQVMRINNKFDEPDLRATIYEALNIESE